MSPDLTSRALEQLAALYGLQPSYHDIEGRLWTASPEAVLATLRTLGAPVSGPAGLPEAVREHERRRWDRSAEPVIVAWGGGPLTFDVRLPEAASGDTVQIEVEVEGNTDRPRRIAMSLDDAQTVSRVEEGGTTGLLKRLALPGGLPYGYHRMRISSRRAVSESLIVSAPERCPEPGGGSRQWGAFLPLYAMRSRSSWGIGDFTDLQTFAGLVGSRGGQIAGTLPMLAAFLDVPFEFSPYVPVSRLFWNEIFVDVLAIPELAGSAAARAIAESRETREAIGALQEADLVDYARVMALKRKVLFELSRSVRGSGGATAAAIRKFVDERPEAVDYARFRATGEKHRAPWQSWPRTGAGPASRPEGFDPEIEWYHLFVQWVAERQIAAAARGAADKGVGLYLDLPTGVHASGYDVYRYRDLFVQDVSAGAPPDTFFGRGQDWGFPPLHPSRQREQGYGYLIDVLRHHLRHARMLRVDHIMWLHRLFYIPRGMEAKDGVYVRYPAEELHAILCLEAHRSGAAIVGEDLGTVPDEVRAEMGRHGIHRLYIAQMEINGHGAAALRDVPGECLASVNTHDMPTFAGYWEGRDIQDRVDLGLTDAPGAVAERERRSALRDALIQFLRDRGILGSAASPGDVLRSCLRFLAASRARFVLLNLEDLWLEARPQNVPGTVEDRANWRRKARYSLNEVDGLAEVDAALREIGALRTGHDGTMRNTGSPGSLLTQDDLHWFNEGTHFRLYDRLGAHPMTLGGARGTYFAVWAPNAERVFVMGDWNGWRNDERALAPRGGSGIWEGFVPGVDPGHLYKYHVVSRLHGYRVDKADPFALYNEVPPKTGSVVWDLAYAWEDAAWMRERAARHTMQAPVAIYEVHLGSWRRVPEEKDRSLTYRELAAELPEYVRRLGFTHVEFMPVMEHPFYGSWGYQTTGYFAPTSRYGTPQDFMHLIDRLHQAGIGVILDWVPSHFPTDEHGPGYFDGTHLFEHADERQGFHPDWKSAIFNYGRNELRSFLISSAQFWLSAYHADGLRVDAVASMLYLDYSRKPGEWIPNPHGGRENLEAIAFLRRFNEEVYKEHPDAQTIAEESTSWPMVSRPTYLGGLGFGLKWDMGWMHDTLKYMAHDPVHRKHHHDMLTFRQLYAFHENFVLPLSHDEVVHGKGSLLGKMPGDEWQKFANLRLLMSYLYTQPGKKLLFMGCEFGQSSEWNHDTSLDWHLTRHERHAGIQRLVADLNRLYRDEPALHELDAAPEGFEWIDPSDGSQSCLSYLRKDRRGSPILVALNFTPVPRNHYRLGVPRGGAWKEILNSDATEYGGSGHGNLGGRVAAPRPSHGRSHSLTLTLPPLGAVLFKPVP